MRIGLLREIMNAIPPYLYALILLPSFEVYGLSVIEDPTLAASGVTKDTVIVGQKAEPSPMDDVKRPGVDSNSVLRSDEVSTCLLACRSWANHTN